VSGGKKISKRDTDIKNFFQKKTLLFCGKKLVRYKEPLHCHTLKAATPSCNGLFLTKLTSATPRKRHQNSAYLIKIIRNLRAGSSGNRQPLMLNEEISGDAVRTCRHWEITDSKWKKQIKKQADMSNVCA